MAKGQYIKIDGVCLSVDWVKGMTPDQFKADAQVNALFSRISEDKRSDYLSIVYETVTGRKARSGGAKPQPSNDTPADKPKEETPKAETTGDTSQNG